jgi:hypothetical protein
METQLPPGPRMPTALQTIGWWSRPTAYLERCRARYGGRFTSRVENSASGPSASEIPAAPAVIA